MSHTLSRPRSLRRICCSVALGVTAAFCVAGLVWGPAPFEPAPEALAAIPNWEDLIGEVPADRNNAALLYQQAFDRTMLPYQPSRALRRILQSGNPPDAPQLAGFAAMVSENTEVLALVHEAGKRPHCVYPLVPHDSLTRPSVANGLHDVVLLETARALVLADRGDTAGAFTALADGLDCLRDTFRGLPAAGSLLSEARGLRMSCAAARMILADAQVGDADVEMFAAALRRFDLHADLVTALRAESAWTLALLDAACGIDTGRCTAIHRQVIADWPELPVILVRINRKVFVESMAAMIERASEPDHALSLMQPHDRPVVPAHAQHGTVLLPAERLLLVARDESTAWQRMCLIALEIARREEAPSSLQDLLPALDAADLQDIFTSRALHYTKTPGGFSLYSFGSDLDDDGGVPQHRLCGVAKLRWRPRLEHGKVSAATQGTPRPDLPKWRQIHMERGGESNETRSRDAGPADRTGFARSDGRVWW